jgi:hypothetical protein
MLIIRQEVIIKVLSNDSTVKYNNLIQKCDSSMLYAPSPQH